MGLLFWEKRAPPAPALFPMKRQWVVDGVFPDSLYIPPPCPAVFLLKVQASTRQLLLEVL